MVRQSCITAMLAAMDWGKYGVFTAKYKPSKSSDTTVKRYRLKVLLGSHFMEKWHPSGKQEN